MSDEPADDYFAMASLNEATARRLRDEGYITAEQYKEICARHDWPVSE